jgi:hypothetical protein
MVQDSRGFTLFDTVTDCHGTTVQVKESSSAESYRVWLFLSGDTGALELDRDGVDQLVAALQAWQEMDNGSA